MSEGVEIQPGYRWVRQIWEGSTSDWCIAKFYGKAPFLRGDVVLVAGTIEPGLSQISDPNDWEFGPELEIPPWE